MSDLITPNQKLSTIPIAELRKWDIFTSVDDKLLENIRLAYAFGELGFLVTTEDIVYSLGSNRQGCLGIGDSTVTCSVQPVKVDAVCGQCVIDFSCGGNFEYTFCFALTADHRIFAWGRNDCGELGIGYSNTTELSPKLVDLGEIKIAKIASGFGHSLALTADTGEVYAFGRNYRGELGLGDRSDRSNPCKVEGLGSAKIMQISCTAFSSFALTEFGEVYSWGDSENGQLGILQVSENTISTPTKMIIDKPVKKIANGAAHTLALTTDGQIYACGLNSTGQLGTGDDVDRSALTNLGDHWPIFDDICATTQTYQSFAKAGNRAYFWGEIIPGESSYTSPTEMVNNMSNFPSPVTVFNKRQFMHASISVKDK